MKIDSSRFNAFWANPDRYRIRECRKIQPKEPSAGTFAELLTRGRKRGTAVHEILDARYRRVHPRQILADLQAGGFDAKIIETAFAMADAIPDEEILAHEVLFEYDIPGTTHTMTGRIDRIVRREDGVYILDYKTSKPRTKAEVQRKLDEYCRSSQVGFYYTGAAALGFDVRGFTYSLVSKRGDRMEAREQTTTRNSIELKRFQRTVALTCDIIEYLKATVGTEDHWPILSEPFITGYESILGCKMFDEYMPEGFEPKKEHLISMETV